MVRMEDLRNNLEDFQEALKSEASVSWERNNYFLVVASILLLALSQFHGLPTVQISVVLLGAVLGVAWVLVQYRSAQYVKYWKEETRRLGKQLGQTAEVYSKSVKGIETRIILFVVPIVFVLLWIALFSMLITGSIKI